MSLIISLDEFRALKDISEYSNLIEYIKSESFLDLIEENRGLVEEDILEDLRYKHLKNEAELQIQIALDENIGKWFDNVASTAIDNVKNIYDNIKGVFFSKSLTGNNIVNNIKNKLMGTSFRTITSFNLTNNIRNAAFGKLFTSFYHFKHKYLFAKYYSLDIDKKTNRYFLTLSAIKKQNPHLSYYDIETAMMNYPELMDRLQSINLYDKNLRENYNNLKSSVESGNEEDITFKVQLYLKYDDNNRLSFYQIYDKIYPFFEKLRKITPTIEKYMSEINSYMDKVKNEEDYLKKSKILLSSGEITLKMYDTVLDALATIIKEYIKILMSAQPEEDSGSSANFGNPKNKEEMYSKMRIYAPYFKDNKLLDMYKLLNIKPNATDKEIKKAQKELVVKFHPDRVGAAASQEGLSQKEINDRIEAATEMMKGINFAVTTLTNPETRDIYDMLYSNIIEKIPRKKEKNTIKDKPLKKKNKSSLQKVMDSLYDLFKKKKKNTSAANEVFGFNTTATSVDSKSAQQDKRQDHVRVATSIAFSLLYSPLVLSIPVSLIDIIVSNHLKKKRIEKLLKNSKNLTDAERKKYEQQLKNASRRNVKYLSQLEDFKEKNAIKVKKLREKYKDDPEKLKEIMKKINQHKKRKVKRLNSIISKSSNKRRKKTV